MVNCVCYLYITSEHLYRVSSGGWVVRFANFHASHGGRSSCYFLKRTNRNGNRTPRNCKNVSDSFRCCRLQCCKVQENEDEPSLAYGIISLTWSGFALTGIACLQKCIWLFSFSIRCFIQKTRRFRTVSRSA